MTTALDVLLWLCLSVVLVLWFTAVYVIWRVLRVLRKIGFTEAIRRLSKLGRR